MLDGRADPGGDCPSWGCGSPISSTASSPNPPARTGGRRDRPGRPVAEASDEGHRIPGRCCAASMSGSPRRRATAETGSPAGDPFVRAAAVLHVFDAARLHPFGPSGAPSAEGRDALVQASVRAIGYQQARLRTLRAGRPQGGAVGPRQPRRDACRAGRQPGPAAHRVQLMFERWLTPSCSTRDRMSYVELENLLKSTTGASTAEPGLPPFPLVEVAAQHGGPRSQCSSTSSTTISPAGPPRCDAMRGTCTRTRLGGVGRCSISGAGGSGQDRADRPILHGAGRRAPSNGCPFAYLPFDSRRLDVREPFTLLSRPSAAQLGVAARTGPIDLAAVRAGGGVPPTVEQLPRRTRLAAAAGQRVRRAWRAGQQPVRGRASSSTTRSPSWSGGRPLGGRAPAGAAGVRHLRGGRLPGRGGPARVLGDAAVPARRLPAARRDRRPRPSRCLDARPVCRCATRLGDLRPRRATALLVRRGVRRPGDRSGASPADRRQPAVAAAAPRRWPWREPGHDRSAGTAPARCRAPDRRRADPRPALPAVARSTSTTRTSRTLAHPGMVLRRMMPAVIEDASSPRPARPTSWTRSGPTDSSTALRREQTLVSVAESTARCITARRSASRCSSCSSGTGRRRCAASTTRRSRYDSTQAEPADRAEEIYHRHHARRAARRPGRRRWMPARRALSTRRP